jgi:C_GCAxxG_C_C family probable redox protein
MSRAEDAERAFRAGCSCSQAVLQAFSPELGLPRDMALKVAAGFGGGLGRLGQTCGAVTGAIMVLGLRHSGPNPADRSAREHIYAQVRKFVAQFNARHGSTLCRELLGCDISTPEGWQQAHAQGLITTRCPEFIRGAVEILGTL